MRGRIRVGAIGLGWAGLAVLTLVTPAAGERYAPDQGCDRGCQTPAGGMGGDCQDASMSTPRAEAGAVKLTSDVHNGATVAPGQDILLTLSWDPKQWSGKELDPGFVLVNPLHAAAPVPPIEPSPYLPMTRRFVNPLWVKVLAWSVAVIIAALNVYLLYYTFTGAV